MRSLARYDPFEEMRRLQKEMDELFSSWLEHRGDEEKWGVKRPDVDIIDEGERLKVIADMPGVDKSDISVSVDKESVEISAERKGAKEEKKKDYYYCERSYSSYRRVIRLPHPVEPESAEAEYKNGVLSITLRKSGSAGRREVEVK